MSIKIKGGYSINELNVNSENRISINTPYGSLSGVTGTTAILQNKAALSSAGFFIATGEVDDGTVMSEKTIRPIFVTQDFRTLRNLETPIWNDTFSHSVINNTKYSVKTLTQTISMSSGFLNLNSSDSTTINEFSMLTTFKSFPVYESAPVYVSFKAKFSDTLKDNSAIEFGLGIVPGAGALIPTDGFFFSASAGTLNTLSIKNTFITSELDVFPIEANTAYDFLIAADDNSVEFWIDNVMVSRLIPSSLTGGTSLSNTLPLFIRNKNYGTVASPVQFQVHSCGVLLGDIKLNKGWRTNMSLNGNSSISDPDGQPNKVTGNTSANLVNSTIPNVSLCTNTTAGYTTLGGDFAVVASAGTENDYVVFSYLNPAGTSSIPGKSLIIQSVNIDTYTSGATMGATATHLQWSLGLGGTATSLEEVDSLTDGTRASRRIGLGSQSIAASAAVGSMATPRVEFQPRVSIPLIVEQGTYFNVILKVPIGLETANLIYRGQVTINGYFD